MPTTIRWCNYDVIMTYFAIASTAFSLSLEWTNSSTISLPSCPDNGIIRYINNNTDIIG